MNKQVRKEIIAVLADRDGFVCKFPECERPFTDDDPPTLDHFIPKSAGGQDHIDNYRLMHFSCNNKKGNVIPNEDGSITLTRRVPRTHKRDRPKLCEKCISGRKLKYGQQCKTCGSGPQPLPYPTAYKRKPSNCSHGGRDHCLFCIVGIVERCDV